MCRVAKSDLGKAVEAVPSVGGSLSSVGLRNGERDALDRLVQACWPELIRFLWKRTTPEEARDVAQSALLSAYRAWLRGAGPRGGDVREWVRYLSVIARNLLIDRARRIAAQPLPVSFDQLMERGEQPGRDTIAEVPGSSVMEESVSAEESSAIRRCLERLELEARALCWLHFVDGVSKREIARSLGRPESSVRADMVGALASLRQCLRARGISA